MIEHVTGVVPVELPDGRIRLERWDATIIGPRSIARAHALKPIPEVRMPELDQITTRRAVPELRRQVILAYADGMSGLVGALAAALNVLAAAEDTAHLTRCAGIQSRDTLPGDAERQARAALGDSAESILGPADYYTATINVVTGELRVYVPGWASAPDQSYGPDDGPAAGRITHVHLAPWHDGEGGLDRAVEALSGDWRVQDDFLDVAPDTDRAGIEWTTIVVPTDRPAGTGPSADDTVSAARP